MEIQPRQTCPCTLRTWAFITGTPAALCTLTLLFSVITTSDTNYAIKHICRPTIPDYLIAECQRLEASRVTSNIVSTVFGVCTFILTTTTLYLALKQLRVRVNSDGSNSIHLQSL